VLGDGAGQLDEGRQPAAVSPDEPVLEQAHGASGSQLEDLAELLLEEVGAVEALVGLLDQGELGLLACGQVFRVLPEREPGSLEFPGDGSLAAPPGRVPDLAPDLVEGLGRPGETWKGSMQRVGWGQRSATTVAIQLAASALTKAMAAQRSSPSSSKNFRSVASSWPTAAQISRPRSWSTTTVR
jgi:hypothetical protein